jgi:hypothetical protein
MDEGRVRHPGRFAEGRGRAPATGRKRHRRTGVAPLQCLPQPPSRAMMLYPNPNLAIAV